MFVERLAKSYIRKTMYKKSVPLFAKACNFMK